MTPSRRHKQPRDRELAGDLVYEEDRRVLDEHERMTLIGADQDAFLNAVMDPPKSTEKLLAALRRHREVLGSTSRDFASGTVLRGFHE